MKKSEYKIEDELIAEGEEDILELLDILEEGLKQCKCGKGISTEELKEKLKKTNKKYKKMLTKLE